jgi:putative heme iron utilization protein
MTQTIDLSAVLDECQQFPRKFQSLHLATCNTLVEPEASYAAYVEHDGSYFVYVSELSAHTVNLATQGWCSVLFIESEAEAKHLFARRRLTLQCMATECSRDTPEFEARMDMFTQKFGDFMGMMRRLTDFHLYQLKPQSGAYVAGFAQAFTLEGEGLLTIKHRTEQGHRQQGKPDAVNNQIDGAKLKNLNI